MNEEEEEEISIARDYILFHSCHVQCRYFSRRSVLTSFFLSLSPYTVVDDDENDVR
jgi:hypothetical protein